MVACWRGIWDSSAVWLEEELWAGNLTAANIFQGGRDNPDTWAALPAAYILDVEDIGSVADERWLEINKIFIHFLFGQRLWEADENKYYEVNR